MTDESKESFVGKTAQIHAPTVTVKVWVLPTSCQMHIEASNLSEPKRLFECDWDFKGQHHDVDKVAVALCAMFIDACKNLERTYVAGRK